MISENFIQRQLENARDDYFAWCVCEQAVGFVHAFARVVGLYQKPRSVLDRQTEKERGDSLL
jgi:hypothetical protein